jgi:hypothetical protein
VGWFCIGAKPFSAAALKQILLEKPFSMHGKPLALLSGLRPKPSI